MAVTANSIDVDLAKLAQSRTSNPDVKQFATTMITDHSAVNAQATALATKLGVTPKDNAVSQSLLKGAPRLARRSSRSRARRSTRPISTVKWRTTRP